MSHRAMLSLSFPFGSFVSLTASFTRAPTAEEIEDGTACNADDWQPVDPSSVTAKVKRPNGDISEHAYEDSPADIEKDGVGEYHLNVYADAAGTWVFRFVGTGVAQSANEHKFKVLSSEIEVE